MAFFWVTHHLFIHFDHMASEPGAIPQTASTMII
jgi:hypothetical protein